MEKINTDRLLAEIDYLSQFMLPERLESLKKVLCYRTKYVTLCLENIFHTQNASAIVRSSEAFGLQELHAVEELCEFTPNVNIVRGSDKWIDIHRYQGGDGSREAVAKLKSEGYRIVATSPHTSGKRADSIDLESGKLAIFLGTEKQGVSDYVLECADEHISIDMFGFVESLNVSVCGAIIVNTLISRLHASDIDWRLSSEEQLILLNKWVKKSVKDSENILKGAQWDD